MPKRRKVCVIDDCNNLVTSKNLNAKFCSPCADNMVEKDCASCERRFWQRPDDTKGAWKTLCEGCFREQLSNGNKKGNKEKSLSGVFDIVEEIDDLVTNLREINGSSQMVYNRLVVLQKSLR